jgi:hypothetical protein
MGASQGGSPEHLLLLCTLDEPSSLGTLSQGIDCLEALDSFMCADACARFYMRIVDIMTGLCCQFSTLLSGHS